MPLWYALIDLEPLFSILLWTRLYLTKGETYVKILERVKSSPLFRSHIYTPPAPPYSQHRYPRGVNLDGSDAITPPSSLLFSSAVKLKEFYLHPKRLLFLSHFVFPNLTFELSVVSMEGFRDSQLLDSWKPHPRCERCV